MDESIEISRLKKEIRSLMEEREVLLEGREDIQLLAEISEKVNSHDDEGDIINAILESICVLKDIGYASFLESRNGNFLVASEYRNAELSSVQNEEFSAQKYPDLARAYRAGRLTSEEFEVPVKDNLYIPSPVRGGGDTIARCCLLSVGIAGSKLGLVAIVDFSKKTRLTEKTLQLFERAISMGVSRIETIRMMREIRKLNIELMEKYAQRGARLKVSEENYVGFVEQAGDAIVMCDADGKLTLWNKSAKRIFGYTDDEVLGKPLKMLVPRELWLEQLKMMMQVEAGYNIHDQETLRLAKDGSQIPVEISVSGVKGSGGEFVGFSYMLRDMSERKRLEATLRESERKYHSLFENANDPIYLIEPETLRIVDCNKRAEESSGCSNEELEKMTFSDLHPVEERDLLGLKFKEALEGGGPFTIHNLHHVGDDGDRSPVEINSAVVEVGGERLNLCIVHDISSRLRAEKLMKEKDRGIRDAYSSALSAVTGGRLIILGYEDIPGVLGEPISDSYDITSYEDLTHLRVIIEEVIGPYFSNPSTSKDTILAADEASVNSIKHAGRGRLQVFKKDDVVQVLVEDDGPGIDFDELPKATLAAGYSSKLSLGVGFTVMLGVSDSVLLATQPGGGTKIVLERRQETNDELREPKEQHLSA